MKIIEFLQAANTCCFIVFAGMLIMNMHWENMGFKEKFHENRIWKKGFALEEKNSEGFMKQNIGNFMGNLGDYGCFGGEECEKEREKQSKTLGKEKELKKVMSYLMIAVGFFGLGVVVKLGVMFKMQTL